MVDRLEWYEVFDLLEEVGDVESAEAINAAFARTGLAYEFDAENSVITFFDPEGKEFEVASVENLALDELAEKFEPVRVQYERALNALRSIPASDEKAIGEAIGALEAVVRILGGQRDFGANVNRLFAGAPPWAQALAQSLKSLYGYSSQVPGARHGRYTDPLLTHQDALYVVRTCGSAIAFLVGGNRAGRWTT